MWGLLDESRVVFLLKVEQVLQEIDESRLFQDILLGQCVQIERIGERLHKLEFELEPSTVCDFWVCDSGRRWIILIISIHWVGKNQDRAFS